MSPFQHLRARNHAHGIVKSRIYAGRFVYGGEEALKFSRPPSRWRVEVLNDKGRICRYNPDLFEALTNVIDDPSPDDFHDGPR